MRIRKLVKRFIIYFGYLFYHNNASKSIYYHDLHIGKRATAMSTPFYVFEKHINIIRKSGFEIVNIINNPAKQIQISFDDGWKGIYEVKDYFINNNLPITIFLVSDFINKDNYLSREMILEMNSFDVFNFQSHTKSHPTLTTLTHEQLLYEFTQSKNDLEKLLGSNVTEICFPKGIFNNAIIDIAKIAGYSKFYSSIPGKVTKEDTLISRCLSQSASKQEIKWILFGGLEIFKSRYINTQKL